jgi:hypothetical protein
MYGTRLIYMVYMGLPDVQFLTGLSGILAICPVKKIEVIPDMHVICPYSHSCYFFSFFVTYTGVQDFGDRNMATLGIHRACFFMFMPNSLLFYKEQMCLFLSLSGLI